VLEQIPFAGGYAVDLGLLIDVAERFGPGGIVQCDLGVRVHRNRQLSELGPQAMAILQLALSRVGVEPGNGPAQLPWHSLLWRPGLEPAPVVLSERPPLAEVPAHRKTA
jgi:glucosyl-3-phosphoglycerate synthase